MSETLPAPMAVDGYRWIRPNIQPALATNPLIAGSSSPLTRRRGCSEGKIFTSHDIKARQIQRLSQTGL